MLHFSSAIILQCFLLTELILIRTSASLSLPNNVSPFFIGKPGPFVPSRRIDITTPLNIIIILNNLTII